MADKNTPPVFLDRRSYRKRRMMDAIRLTPVLGALLWMVPLLWAEGPQGALDGEPVQTTLSSAIKYVFWVWLGLIVLSAALWRMTRDDVARIHAPDTDS